MQAGHKLQGCSASECNPSWQIPPKGAIYPLLLHPSVPRAAGTGKISLTRRKVILLALLSDWNDRPVKVSAIIHFISYF